MTARPLGAHQPRPRPRPPGASSGAAGGLPGAGEPDEWRAAVGVMSGGMLAVVVGSVVTLVSQLGLV